MKQELVRQSVIEAILDIQRESGWPAQAIGGQTCPITDLPGFDSLNCVEATMLVSERLGVEIEILPLINRTSRKALSINEIAAAIFRSLKEEG